MFDTAPNRSTIAEDTMRGPIELKTYQSPCVAVTKTMMSRRWDTWMASCSALFSGTIIAHAHDRSASQFGLCMVSIMNTSFPLHTLPFWRTCVSVTDATVRAENMLSAFLEFSAYSRGRAAHRCFSVWICWVGC